MLKRSILALISKPVGCVVLGGVVLCQVAEHAASSKGRAIVHVTGTGVEIAVDDATYRVNTIMQTPIVCKLVPGRHTVRMLRDDRVLYQEEFIVARDQEVILTAWDGYRDGRSPGRGSENRE
jgi:hypothetical protein